MESETKELFWFSGVHTNDPEHAMFIDLRREFLDFDPAYVLVEGGAHRRGDTDAEEAKRHGESAYVAFLAATGGIPVSTMEPPLEAQVDALSRRFSGEEILAMYLLRQIVQWQREAGNREIDFSRSLRRYAERVLSTGLEAGAPAPGGSEYLYTLIGRYVDGEINPETWQRVDAYSAIYRDGGALRDVYRAVLAFRDAYSVGVITDALDEYERVFVMMGADHIAEQETALRAYFSDTD